MLTMLRGFPNAFPMLVHVLLRETMQLKRRRCKRDRHELMSAVADASQVARATSPAYGDSFRPRKLVVSTAVQQFTEAHSVDRYLFAY